LGYLVLKTLKLLSGKSILYSLADKALEPMCKCENCKEIKIVYTVDSHCNHSQNYNEKIKFEDKPQLYEPLNTKSNDRKDNTNNYEYNF
jgi:hypothetical protein